MWNIWGEFENFDWWKQDGQLRLFIEGRQGFGEPWPQSWEFVSERCRIWNQFVGKWNYVNK